MTNFWLINEEADALAASFLAATDSSADEAVLSQLWRELPPDARAIVEGVLLQLAIARRQHRRKWKETKKIRLTAA